MGLAADLVDVASEVPAISFHFGHSLREIDAASSTAVLDGPDGRAEAPYDLLVAADGANSTARGLLQARCRGGAAAAAAGCADAVPDPASARAAPRRRPTRSCAWRCASAQRRAATSRSTAWTRRRRSRPSTRRGSGCT